MDEYFAKTIIVCKGTGELISSEIDVVGLGNFVPSAFELYSQIDASIRTNLGYLSTGHSIAGLCGEEEGIELFEQSEAASVHEGIHDEINSLGLSVALGSEYEVFHEGIACAVEDLIAGDETYY